MQSHSWKLTMFASRSEVSDHLLRLFRVFGMLSCERMDVMLTKITRVRYDQTDRKTGV